VRVLGAEGARGHGGVGREDRRAARRPRRQLHPRAGPVRTDKPFLMADRGTWFNDRGSRHRGHRPGRARHPQRSTRPSRSSASGRRRRRSSPVWRCSTSRWRAPRQGDNVGALLRGHQARRRGARPGGWRSPARSRRTRSFTANIVVPHQRRRAAGTRRFFSKLPPAGSTCGPRT